MQVTISIPPIPKFASRWKVELNHCPETWVNIIRLTIIYSLAQHHKLKSKNVDFRVDFINENYFNKMQKKYNTSGKFIVFDPTSEYKIEQKSNSKFIRHVLCSSSMLYQKHQLFSGLVRQFATAILHMIQQEDRLPYVLAKFSITPTNEIQDSTIS